MKPIRPLLILVLAIVPLIPGIADAAVTVEILPVGLVQDDGMRATVFVRVSCDPVGRARQPLEALLTLSQNNQRVYGEGYMTMITCNGRPAAHQVRVDAFERRFRRGVAYASAFVLVCSLNGSVCKQGQDTRNIVLT